MLGYMSAEALERTLADGRATFHSRSKGRLWQKGESSGNYLAVEAVFADCDDDALLIVAEPAGPTCHLGTDSCFTADGPRGSGWLGKLARIVRDRAGADPGTSYTARLLREGPLRIAQKVGEEGVELALAGATRDTAACVEETADLVYHLTVLMEARGFGWEDVAKKLEERHA
jgi:phosphoribosyl-ATP pyrophosphohydrolase/phosphoribosyl-AMP cyclohydrolase